MPDSGDELREALLELVRVYIGILNEERTGWEKRLAALTLREYVATVAAQRVHVNQLPLLPASFSVYAQCVGGILKELIRGLSAPVRVFTFLTRPLSRWYNLHEVELPTYGICTFTCNEWERYKSDLHDLKIAWDAPRPTSPHIQLRRFVDRSSLENAQSLIVFTGHAATAKLLTVEEAKDILTPPRCNVQQGVQNTINSGESNRQLYLIASRANDDAIPVGWKSLVDDFNRIHHNNGLNLKTDGIGDGYGVFCKHISSPAGLLSHYDDVFLVCPHNDRQSGPFGIGWHADRHRGVPGLVFLPDSTIQELVEALTTLWRGG
jgi:hypothetical protein